MKVPFVDLQLLHRELAEELEDVFSRVLKSSAFVLGPEVERFEQEFSHYCGTSYCVAVNTGTAALHLTLAALGVGPGDEVIVPSLTFVATANAVLYVGATPVFADITSLDDWTISPDEIERKLTDRTRAIIVMHYGGFPCAMDRIKAIAEKHGLKVIEDAAHAPGASFQAQKLGTWGDAGCFSFFSNKNMTTGEGGMIVTDSADVAESLKNLRCHGMTSVSWDRHKGHNFSYDVTQLGFNYRIDEIRSALGRIQLAKLDRGNQRRREITLEMRKNLEDIPLISLPFQAHDLDECSCHIFPILLQSADLRIPFMESMKQSGIQTSIHYPPIHKFTGYKEFRTIDLPLTDHVTATEVTLPMFPNMGEDDTTIVIRAAEIALKSE